MVRGEKKAIFQFQTPIKHHAHTNNTEFQLFFSFYSHRVNSLDNEKKIVQLILPMEFPLYFTTNLGIIISNDQMRYIVYIIAFQLAIYN